MKEPFLAAVQNVDIEYGFTLVKIKYLVPNTVSGFELMGVDAGLSWVANKSMRMKRESKVDDEWSMYSGILQLTDSCEFRGRTFDSEGEYWEAGENHRIVKNDDGSFKLITLEEVKKTVDFRPYPPVEWIPTVESAEGRLRKDRKGNNMVQYLVDSIIYVHGWLDRPKVLQLMLPTILANNKRNLRKIDSAMGDEIVLPLLKIFYEIIMEIRITDETQDPRILPGTFEKRHYGDTMLTILDKISTCPVFNPDIEMSEEERFKDTFRRMQLLFKLI